MKLTMQIAQHLEYARPDTLSIVYYAGYGFVGSDHSLYWAWYDAFSTALWHLLTLRQ
jgi:hypothetical protein